MTTPYERIKEQYDELVAKYKELIADGKLSMQDSFTLLLMGSGAIVRFLSDYTDLDYDKRKAIGVDLISQFYADVIAPLDIPGIPNIIEPMIDSAIQNVIPAVVGAIYDGIHALIIDKING